MDLPGAELQPTSDLFNNYRPEAAIMNNSSVNTWELTVCYETNLLASKQYKINKYSGLSKFCTILTECKTFRNFTVEISTLGLIFDISDFLNVNGLPILPMTLKQDIIRTVLNSTFKIYCNQNFFVT